MITINKDKMQFGLHSKNFSYVFYVNQFGYLRSLHVGARVETEDLTYLAVDIERGFCPTINSTTNRKYSLDSMPNEFPIFGNGDFRHSAILCEDNIGNRLHDLKYSGYKILKEKPPIKGIPSVGGSETLVITLESINIKADLFYTVYDNFDCLTRRTEITNIGKNNLDIMRAMSLSVDLPTNKFKLGTLYGRHTNECNFELTHLRHGITSVYNSRGSACHQFNPFLCLTSLNATEHTGEVFGFNLCYSGNFLCQAEVDQTCNTRVQMGINPFDFNYSLSPNETFYTPECVMTFSNQGINKMSQNFHNLYREHLISKTFVYKCRPIVINNWEATYFNFDNAKLFEIIDNCDGTNIDTLVLDDGWFGERNGDNGGLGDWKVNVKKLEGGLNSVVRHCKEHNMKFGLWFEPEMVNPNSDLYRLHPDWCIHIDNISPTLARSQLVLDLSRREVLDYVKQAVSDILSSYDISYVKWDFNRNITDAYSTELCYKYMLGLYELAGYLTSSFPNILFEGCSGGGGRFAPDMLAYFPQLWTSDCTDAYERTKIQYGTSVCYPLSSMSSHVSVCPNHQTLRISSLQTRIDIATLTNFGYELNPSVFDEAERKQIAQANLKHNENSSIILEGDLFRLASPFDGNNFAWLIVSKDKCKALFTYFTALCIPNGELINIKFLGLCETQLYYIEEMKISLLGKTLISAGITFPPEFGDFTTKTLTLTAK